MLLGANGAAMRLRHLALRHRYGGRLSILEKQLGHRPVVAPIFHTVRTSLSRSG